MTAPAGRKSRGPIASFVARATGSRDDGQPAAPVTGPQHWRDLATMTAGLAFETDAAGVFTFVGPNPALGWTPEALLGRPGEQILSDLGGADSFNPFRPGMAVRHRRCWVRQEDGSIACLSFSVSPLTAEDGQVIGAYGLGIDLSEQDPTDSAVASALRRADVIDFVLRDIRVEMLPDRVMQQTLRALVNALGCEGALVIDAAIEPGIVLHQVGGDADSVVATACHQLRSGEGTAPANVMADDRPVLVSPCATRFGGETGLVLWRRPGVKRWDAQDLAILSSAGGLIRVILEHVFVQSEMVTHARTDSLTGLANRRAFLDEVPRHIDRLARDTQPGTLLLITLEDFGALNDRLGYDVGDEALRIATALLRVTFRPGDVIARLGGAEFAVWMNGADEMTAAERAEALTTDGLQQFTHLGADQVTIGISIGIAMRWPGGSEDVEELRTRADIAIKQVRSLGTPGWKVWHAAK